MKANDLVFLLTKECKPDDEIFITDVRGNHRTQYNPDIAIQKIDITDTEGVELHDVNSEEIKGKWFHIF